MPRRKSSPRKKYRRRYVPIGLTIGSDDLVDNIDEFTPEELAAISDAVDQAEMQLIEHPAVISPRQPAAKRSVPRRVRPMGKRYLIDEPLPPSIMRDTAMPEELMLGAAEDLSPPQLSTPPSGPLMIVPPPSPLMRAEDFQIPDHLVAADQTIKAHSDHFAQMSKLIKNYLPIPPGYSDDVVIVPSRIAFGAEKLNDREKWDFYKFVVQESDANWTAEKRNPFVQRGNRNSTRRNYSDDYKKLVQMYHEDHQKLMGTIPNTWNVKQLQMSYDRKQRNKSETSFNPTDRANADMRRRLADREWQRLAAAHHRAQLASQVALGKQMEMYFRPGLPPSEFAKMQRTVRNAPHTSYKELLKLTGEEPIIQEVD